MGHPYVVFDRDGTLIEHVHHLVNPEKVRFKCDLGDSLVSLKQANFRLGIISNQSVVERGLATVSQVQLVNAKIAEFLRTFGVSFEFIYFCPHMPDTGCGCRKPRIELGIKAILENGLDTSKSYMVGDQESDIIFGKKLGCKTVHLLGNTQKSIFADYHSKSLEESVRWILIDRENRGF